MTSFILSTKPTTLLLSVLLPAAVFAQNDDVSAALEEARRALDAANIQIDAAGLDVTDSVEVDAERVRVGEGIDIDASGVRVGEGVAVDAGGVRTDGVAISSTSVHVEGSHSRAVLIDASAIIAALSVGKDAAIDLTVNFANDSDEVLGAARAQVLEIATALKDEAMQSEQVLIEGHTDANGDFAYNDDLSHRRAIAVMRMLSEEYGIGSDRLSVKGLGEQAPIASNATAEGRALNRRVTLRNIGG